jgi:DNA helicase-2/ATP-dependent DNA helicase PcrA
MLKAFVDKGLHYSDIAILTRTNAQISRIKGVMDEIGLPAIVVSGDDDPFKKSDIQGIMAWMDIVINMKDSIHLRRALSFPNEFLSRLSIQKLQLEALKREVSLFMAIYESQEGQDFKETYDQITDRMLNGQYIASDLFRTLIDILGIRQRYVAEKLTNRMKEADRAYNAILRWEESRSNLGENYDADVFLKWFRYRDIQEKMIQANQDAVKLMTVHASKGLEFPVVIIAGLADGIFPSRKSADLEEERRLFYVALTRAKDHLILTYPEMTETWGGKEVPAQESRFIKEALG